MDEEGIENSFYALDVPMQPILRDHRAETLAVSIMSINESMRLLNPSVNRAHSPTQTLYEERHKEPAVSDNLDEYIQWIKDSLRSLTVAAIEIRGQERGAGVGL